jgi:hypothetical protein
MSKKRSHRLRHLSEAAVQAVVLVLSLALVRAILGKECSDLILDDILQMTEQFDIA